MIFSDDYGLYRNSCRSRMGSNSGHAELSFHEQNELANCVLCCYTLFELDSSKTPSSSCLIYTPANTDATNFAVSRKTQSDVSPLKPLTSARCISVKDSC